MPAKAKLPKGKGKRVPLNMRTTQEMRGHIERAAADSGRSLVQEVEYRLERSFIEEDQRTRQFGDARWQALWRLLASVAGVIETQTGADPFDDYATSKAAYAAFVRILDNFLLLPEPEALAAAKAEFEAEKQAWERTTGLNRLAVLAGRVKDAPPYPAPPSDPGYEAAKLGKIVAQAYTDALDRQGVARKRAATKRQRG